MAQGTKVDRPIITRPRSWISSIVPADAAGAASSETTAAVSTLAMNILIFFIEKASLSADRRYFFYSIVLFECAVIVYGFPCRWGAMGAALRTAFIAIS